MIRFFLDKKIHGVKPFFSFEAIRDIGRTLGCFITNIFSDLTNFYN